MKIIPDLPNNEITPEIIRQIKETDIEELKKTEAYKKHCLPSIQRHEKLKKQNNINWWKNNWIGIVTLIITTISLITTVLFGLLQLLK